MRHRSLTVGVFSPYVVQRVSRALGLRHQYGPSDSDSDSGTGTGTDTDVPVASSPAPFHDPRAGAIAPTHRPLDPFAPHPC
ncbi:hypothetical protein RB200_35370 [Streptomyces sp. PmtG]